MEDGGKFTGKGNKGTLQRLKNVVCVEDIWVPTGNGVCQIH
jgi:hypothetical protein